MLKIPKILFGTKQAARWQEKDIGDLRSYPTQSKGKLPTSSTWEEKKSEPIWRRRGEAKGTSRPSLDRKTTSKPVSAKPFAHAVFIAASMGKTKPQSKGPLCFPASKRILILSHSQKGFFLHLLPILVQPPQRHDDRNTNSSCLKVNNTQCIIDFMPCPKENDLIFAIPLLQACNPKLIKHFLLADYFLICPIISLRP